MWDYLFDLILTIVNLHKEERRAHCETLDVVRRCIYFNSKTHTLMLSNWFLGAEISNHTTSSWSDCRLLHCWCFSVEAKAFISTQLAGLGATIASSGEESWVMLSFTSWEERARTMKRRVCGGAAAAASSSSCIWMPIFAWDGTWMNKKYTTDPNNWSAWKGLSGENTYMALWGARDSGHIATHGCCLRFFAHFLLLWVCLEEQILEQNLGWALHSQLFQKKLWTTISLSDLLPIFSDKWEKPDPS